MARAIWSGSISDAKTLRTATQLIESLAAPWKPETYHDTYAEDLRTRKSA